MWRSCWAVRGGEQTQDKWKIRLQLTKPVTWVPLIWGAWGSPDTSGRLHMYACKEHVPGGVASPILGERSCMHATIIPGRITPACSLHAFSNIILSIMLHPGMPVDKKGVW